MKNLSNFKFISLILLSSILFSCKKKPVEPGNDPINKPKESISTPQGQPVGNATQKTIGAAGGNIELSDEFELLIPAGAVDKDVNFSVQEVNHTLPYGKISKTYHFLPEGVEFKKPVKLTIHYSVFGQGNTQAFKLAYQDKTGHWFVPRNSVVDESSGSISVETKHFSNWTVVETMEIKVDLQQIEKGAQTGVEVLSRLVEDETDGDFLLMPEDQTVDLKDAKVTWKTTSSGPEPLGKFSSQNAWRTVFTAPAIVYGKKRKTCNLEATITAKNGSEITLYDKVKVLSDEYCYGKIGWKDFYESDDVVALKGSNGGMYVTFIYTGFGEQYHFSTPDASRITPFDKANVIISQPYARYDTHYWDCSTSSAAITTGDIIIVSVKDGLVEAIAKGEIRRKTGNCYEDPEPFEFNFRYRTPQ